jgi:hypothetical protein
MDWFLIPGHAGKIGNTGNGVSDRWTRAATIARVTLGGYVRGGGFRPALDQHLGAAYGVFVTTGGR